MRVLAFCDYFHPTSSGGAERVAAEVYRRAGAEDDVELMVLGAVPKDWLTEAGRPGVAEASVWSGQPFEVRLARGYDLTRLLGAQLMVAPALARRAREAIRAFRPDVVHVNGLHFHSTVAGLRAARRAGVPVVATAHLGDVSAMPGRAARASVLFDRYLGGWAARSSDHLLAVSESVRSHLCSLGVDSGRVSIAYNGVDHDRFEPSRRTARREELRVAIVGRLVGNKGPLEALDALGKARAAGHDIRLDVIGDGPLLAKARERAAQRDLAGVVRFHGHVADVAPLMREIDVLLRPSFSEGLPLAVLEAMAAGVVVVCSAVPGNVEAVGSEGREGTGGAAGVVVPIGDIAAASRALINLHEQRAELDRLSVAAAARAQRFTWDRSASEHLAAWHHAAMKSRPTGEMCR